MAKEEDGGRKSSTFSTARDRERPIRRSSPLRRLPTTSNFLRDHMVSKGFNVGGGFAAFMAAAAGPEGRRFAPFPFFFFSFLEGSERAAVFAIDGRDKEDVSREDDRSGF